MTIIEAIGRADAAKPNTCSQEEKIRWLSVLDGNIKLNVIDTHEGDDILYIPYDGDTPLDTVLLVPSPWDELYIRWLEAQIDYANGEWERYNNAVAAYNAAYEAFAKHYNRTHMPRRVPIRYK